MIPSTATIRHGNIKFEFKTYCYKHTNLFLVFTSNKVAEKSGLQQLFEERLSKSCPKNSEYPVVVLHDRFNAAYSKNN